MTSSYNTRKYLNIRKGNNYWILLLFASSFLLTLAGCNGDLQFPVLTNVTPTATSISDLPPDGENTDQTQQTTAEPVISPDSPTGLVLWVPPQFGPAGNLEAWELLQARLEEFSSINPEIAINVRVKAPDGTGGMLDSLSSAGAAAPLSLPSLALLSRSDLEVAALKGLVYPLDDISISGSEAAHEKRPI